MGDASSLFSCLVYTDLDWYDFDDIPRLACFAMSMCLIDCFLFLFFVLFIYTLPV